jgi:hypothetical protein
VIADMPSITTNCAALFAVTLLWTTPMQAQPGHPDTATGPESRAITLYHEQLGDESAIYNGLAYQPYDGDLIGSPYFGVSFAATTIPLVTATVTYDSLEYTSIPVVYDLVHDKLIIADPKGELITLSNGKVQGFFLGGRHFTSLTIDGSPGFYEVLVSGRLSLFAKRTKRIDEDIVDGRVRRVISIHDHYYLLKDGAYTEVSSERHFLQLTADKKKDLHQFEKTNDIRFGKDPADAMRQLTDYYNQLSR